MKRRTVIASVGSPTLFSGSSNFAQVAHLNDAINTAGRQRMLSQRVVKAYLAAGQGVAPQRARDILVASMALFDRQLVELRVFAPSAEIKNTYNQLEAVWNDYKTALVGQTTRRGSSRARTCLWRAKTSFR